MRYSTAPTELFLSEETALRWTELVTCALLCTAAVSAEEPRQPTAAAGLLARKEAELATLQEEVDELRQHRPAPNGVQLAAATAGENRTAAKPPDKPEATEQIEMLVLVTVERIEPARNTLPPGAP